MQQGQHQINVDLKQAEDVGCEKCEGLYFTPVIMVKRLSALISPTGQELKFPVQCFQCKECGHILEPPEAQ